MNYTQAQDARKNHAVFSAYEKLVLAVPRGRIAEQLSDILTQVGIVAEQDFFNKKSRKLRFSANDGALDLISVRSFDVATYVMGGGAHFGIVGSDVLLEHGTQNIYNPINLDIGHCRLVVAGFADSPDLFSNHFNHHKGRLRIATKYPNTARNFFAKQGLQVETIKLSGSIELAPHLGLCDYIVDLVSTGATLKANNLVEITTIADISSRLIVNSMAWKTRNQDILTWINRFEEVCHHAKT